MPPISSDEAYRQAGVDLKRAEAVVDIAKSAAGKTRASSEKSWMLGGIGGFSGAFEIPEGYRQPVLLSACDGVGTKLKLAFMSGIHHTVGIDLVAMSVNDLLVNGGKPLVFLDYVATDQIRPEILAEILNGIAEGCAQADCVLAGGETAELPGFYTVGEYDLAGFAVGVVEKSRMLPCLDAVQPGDILVGLPSSGLHSNGYSLVRKILFEENASDWQSPNALLGTTPMAAAMAPTRIYVREVLQLLEACPDAVKAMAHITGGGFYDNIPRVLPEGISACIDKTTWRRPPIFQLLQEKGHLSDETLFHTFNCGIGMVLVLQPDAVSSVLDWFKANVTAYAPVVIGQLESTPGACQVHVQ